MTQSDQFAAELARNTDAVAANTAASAHEVDQLRDISGRLTAALAELEANKPVTPEQLAQMRQVSTDLEASTTAMAGDDAPAV